MSGKICTVCGGNLKYIHGQWKCVNCDAYHEEKPAEERILLSNAAEKLRAQAFDEAEELYLDIIHGYELHMNKGSVLI